MNTLLVHANPRANSLVRRFLMTTLVVVLATPAGSAQANGEILIEWTAPQSAVDNQTVAFDELNEAVPRFRVGYRPPAAGTPEGARTCTPGTMAEILLLIDESDPRGEALIQPASAQFAIDGAPNAAPQIMWSSGHDLHTHAIINNETQNGSFVLGVATSGFRIAPGSGQCAPSAPPEPPAARTTMTFTYSVAPPPPPPSPEPEDTPGPGIVSVALLALGAAWLLRRKA